MEFEEVAKNAGQIDPLLKGMQLSSNMQKKPNQKAKMEMLEDLVRQRKSLDVSKVQLTSEGSKADEQEEKKMNQVRQSIEMQMNQILKEVKPPKENGYSHKDSSLIRQSMEFLNKPSPESKRKTAPVPSKIKAISAQYKDQMLARPFRSGILS